METLCYLSRDLAVIHEMIVRKGTEPKQSRELVVSAAGDE